MRPRLRPTRGAILARLSGAVRSHWERSPVMTELFREGLALKSWEEKSCKERPGNMKELTVTLCLCLLCALPAPLLAGHRRPQEVVKCRIMHPDYYYHSQGRRRHGRFETRHFRRYHLRPYRPYSRTRLYGPGGRFSYRHSHRPGGYGVSFRYYQPRRHHRGHHARPRFSLRIDF